MDIIFWYTGAAVWLGMGIASALAWLWLMYYIVRATADVASQLLLLYVEKGTRSSDVTSWDAWLCSFDRARWAIIMYRIRRCIWGKKNVVDPYC